MKLQKQISKKIGNKEYYKYVVIIPTKIIEKIGWEGGEDLEPKVKKDKLIVSKNGN